MGNCGGICAHNMTKYKGDVIMDKLITEKLTSKGIVSYDIEKVQYLQRKIKLFLKKKKNQ